MREWLSLMVGLAGLLTVLPASAQNYVTCESREGGYKECYSGFRYPAVLAQQLSNSSCIEGSTWGHRPGTIWVSRGCRGQFQEGRGGGGGGGNNGVVCESRDNRYRECPTGFRGPVELVEQYSGSRCIEGQTWGSSRGSVWVDGGCRARFAQYYGGQGQGHDDGYWEPSGAYTVQCESKDSRQRTCAWDWNSGTPFLLEQLSSAACVRGRSWGYDRQRNLLWVDQGCRAIFGPR